MSDPTGGPVRSPADARTSPAVDLEDTAPAGTGPWAADDAAAGPGGMARFAGLVLGLAGIWHAVAGLVALTDPAQFLTTTAALPLHVGYQTWGWTHLVVGALALFAGFGVLAQNRLAAVIAVVLAMVSAIVSLVFMKAEPLWSVLIIALDVLVIWGVTTQVRPPEPAR
jgi:hypothetical protein